MTEQPFIELDYTGRADGVVFDTTRKQDAPVGSKGPFEPAVLKLGSGQLIPGLDSFLVGKGPGTYGVTLAAENAFAIERFVRCVRCIILTPMSQIAFVIYHSAHFARLILQIHFGLTAATGSHRVAIVIFQKY